ncbi:MAG TPA: hypothetical protein VKB03_05450 [Conexibacter sp.]|nr:hypothetical protein [Conexibacter sp.]
MRTVRSATRRAAATIATAALVACGGLGLAAAQAAASSDLRLTLTPPAELVVGSQGSFTLVVDSFGPDATSATTTVTDALPPGLAPVAASGTGWSCALAQVVTCTTSAPLAPGAALPAITLTVAASSAALPGVTAAASVANADDPNPANDGASSFVTVRTAHDVAVAVDPVGSFQAGADEQIRVNVTNAGTQPTLGPTTVENTLPPNVAFISADGDGWSCALVAGAPGHLGCTTMTTVAGRLPFARITVHVRPTLDVWPSFVDTSTVTSPGDEFLANNVSSATVRMSGQGPPDLAVHMSGSSLLTVGTRAHVNLYLTRTGATPTGTTTVAMTLPPSLRPLSVHGAGWTCALGQSVTCTRSGTSIDSVSVTVQVTPAAVPSATVSGTVHNDGDRNSANDAESRTFPARAPSLERMNVRPRWRGGRGPRALGGVTVAVGFPQARITARCVAGCRHRSPLLGSAVVGRTGRPLRLSFRRPLVVHRGVVLAIVERVPGSTSRTQRYALVRNGRVGWHLRPLRR